MPLFRLDKDTVQAVPQAPFPSEKALQLLIERNLDAIFNCRLVGSEFPTGAQHGGRIDTLALSEDDNPVIIEYKKVESSELINQSLFYLAWLDDHRGDFQVAVQASLGSKIVIDWSAVRVICIAPTYRKYDLHAVQMMGRSIELWTYRRYANETLLLEEVLQGSGAPASAGPGEKNPVMVAAGKKAAATRAAASWTFAQHVEGKPPEIRNLAHLVQEFMLGIDPAVEEAPKKLYVAYRTTQNIVCMEVQRQKIYLWVKLDPGLELGLGNLARDVSNIGHFGTGKPRDNPPSGCRPRPRAAGTSPSIRVARWMKQPNTVRSSGPRPGSPAGLPEWSQAVPSVRYKSLPVRAERTTAGRLPEVTMCRDGRPPADPTRRPPSIPPALRPSPVPAAARPIVRWSNLGEA